MKKEKLRDTYEESSATVSNLVRQLAFAAIAIIWVFNSNKIDGIKIPEILEDSLKFIVLALIFDFLQYVIHTIIYGYQHSIKEKDKIPEDKEFTINDWWNQPSLFCFICKIPFLIIGYLYILFFLKTFF